MCYYGFMSGAWGHSITAIIEALTVATSSISSSPRTSHYHELRVSKASQIAEFGFNMFFKTKENAEGIDNPLNNRAQYNPAHTPLPQMRPQQAPDNP